MMNKGASRIFESALVEAAFPAHEMLADQKLWMASGLAHYAYICLDISQDEYDLLQMRIQAVRENRAIKQSQASRCASRCD